MGDVMAVFPDGSGHLTLAGVGAPIGVGDEAGEEVSWLGLAGHGRSSVEVGTDQCVSLSTKPSTTRSQSASDGFAQSTASPSQRRLFES